MEHGTWNMEHVYNRTTACLTMLQLFPKRLSSFTSVLLHPTFPSLSPPQVTPLLHELLPPQRYYNPPNQFVITTVYSKENRP